MAGWSPPQVPREWLLGIGLVYVAFLAYSVLIAQQILFGVYIGVVAVSLYLGWRFLRAIEAIADALQRIARQREA